MLTTRRTRSRMTEVTTGVMAQPAGGRQTDAMGLRAFMTKERHVGRRTSPVATTSEERIEAIKREVIQSGTASATLRARLPRRERVTVSTVAWGVFWGMTLFVVVWGAIGLLIAGALAQAITGSLN